MLSLAYFYKITIGGLYMENKIKGSNPVLRGKVFEKNYEYERTATLEGTINKIGFLLVLLIGSAVLSWFTDQTIGLGFMMIAVIIGFILSLIISFVPPSSRFLAPVYAVMEGYVLGFISRMYSDAYADGIVLQAILLTFFIFILMLVVHSIKIIRVNQRFMTYVFVATGAIGLVYLADIVMSMFGVPVAFLHQTGWVGIVISIVIIFIASLNHLVDFQFIQDASNMGVP
jgi:uncharacterized YccA/Bax inhibitor family protein